MRYYGVLAGLLLSGCAVPTKQVRVLKSNSEISVLHLTIDDGDVLVCDNNTCKVVKQ